MSQATSQNATAQAVSVPAEQDIKAWVARLATRAIKNPERVSTTARFQLNFSKLLKSVRDEWKIHNGMVQRVPDETDAILQKECQAFIEAQLAAVNVGNSVALTVRDVLDFKNLRFYEKVTSVGHNTKTLQAQLEAGNRLIRECEDKIAYYEKQDSNGNSQTTKRDYKELIKSAKSRLTELELTKHHIKSVLEQTKKALNPESAENK